MEARYADGSNAGPNALDPCTRSSTRPSRRTTRTARSSCTPDFLKSLRDGELVTLTFDFYSGKKVMYHVKKSGDSVTGTHVPPIS